MTEWLDRSVYDDVAEEARADWLAERPDRDDDAGSPPDPCPQCEWAGCWACVFEGPA